MPRFTITLPDELNEWIEGEVDRDDPTAPDSKSGAARIHLANARRVADAEPSVDELLETHRRLADVDDSLDDLVDARDRVEELEAEVDDLRTDVVDLRAERDDLRRQLAAANQRIDSANEIVEHVREQRSAEQRRREAGILTRAKWWVTGMDTDDEPQSEGGE